MRSLKLLNPISVYNFLYRSIAYLVLYCYFENLLLLIGFIIYELLILQNYIAICLIVFLLLPFNQYQAFEYNSGKVIDIKANSVIIENHRQKLQVYKNIDDLNYGDVISFKGQIVAKEFDVVSYGFNAYRYYQRINVYNQVFTSDIKVIEKSRSLKGKLYQYVNNIDNPTLKSAYLKYFFNQKDDQLNSFYLLSSMYWQVFIVLIYDIFKYFISDSKIKILQIIIIILLMIVLGFNFIFYRILITIGISFFNLDFKKRLIIFSYLQLCFFPNYVSSLAFILPFGFRLIYYYFDNWQFIYSNLFISIAQGLTSLYVNPLFCVLYRYLCKMAAWILLLMIIFIWAPIVTLPFILGFDALITILDQFSMVIKGYPNLYLLSGLVLMFALKFKIYIIYCLYYLSLIFKLHLFFASVTFINVGQGDSVLMRSPFNQEVILYDVGDSYNYHKLKNYLNAYGIDVIDKIIISHDDSDHSGNLEALQSDYKIKSVIKTSSQSSFKKFDLINLNTNIYDDDNDNSLIYLLNFNQLHILLTGDISKRVEYDLMAKYQFKVDVLKVAHHGSKTSTSLSFLDSFKPQISIISTSGKYNHPSVETITSLNKTNSIIYNTKNDGDIQIVAALFFNYIKDSNKNYQFILK